MQRRHFRRPHNVTEDDVLDRAGAKSINRMAAPERVVIVSVPVDLGRTS